MFFRLLIRSVSWLATSLTSCRMSCVVNCLRIKRNTASSACNPTKERTELRGLWITCPSPQPSTANLICKLRKKSYYHINATINEGKCLPQCHGQFGIIINTCNSLRTPPNIQMGEKRKFYQAHCLLLYCLHNLSSGFESLTIIYFFLLILLPSTGTSLHTTS